MRSSKKQQLPISFVTLDVSNARNDRKNETERSAFRSRFYTESNTHRTTETTNGRLANVNIDELLAERSVPFVDHSRRAIISEGNCFKVTRVATRKTVN